MPIIIDDQLIDHSPSEKLFDIFKTEWMKKSIAIMQFSIKMLKTLLVGIIT